MSGLRTVRLAVIASALALTAVTVAGGAPTRINAAATGASGPAATPGGVSGHMRRGITPLVHRQPASKPPATATTSLPPVGAHLDYYGGPVVSTIHVVQVLYGQPSSRAVYEPEVQNAGTSPSVASFYGGVTNSSYLDSMAEYSTTGNPQGVAGTNQTIRRGVFDQQVIITPSAANDPFAVSNPTHTLDDTTQIQPEIKAQITAGTLPRPGTDSTGKLTTLYAIYFPQNVLIKLGNQVSGAPGGFCAYHGTTDTPEAYYSVLPDFSTGGMSLGCGPGTEFQNVTAVSAHEMAEVVTDPEVGLAQGSTAGPPLAWYDINNGENGDICNGNDGTLTGGDGVTYTVQKIWSNRQGACVLAPAPAPPSPPPPPPPPPPRFSPQGVGAPQVAVTPDGSSQLVFWKGPDGRLAEAWYGAGHWNGPITFPQFGSMTSTPSVAVTKDGRTQLVFWQGANGHLYEAWYAGSWNGPVDWTAAWGGRGPLASAPTVVPTAHGDQLVFWRGADGHLWEAWYTGVWNGPVDFSGLGTLASAPSAAIIPGDVQQMVFWQGADNRLTEVWYQGSWNGPVEWTNLGSISSPPSVAITPDGTTQLVFYKSPAGHLLESWYQGSWNGPADFTASVFGGQGPLTSSPSAAVTPDGSQQLVFWQGPGATLWEAWYAAGSWHGPVNFSAG